MNMQYNKIKMYFFITKEIYINFIAIYNKIIILTFGNKNKISSLLVVLKVKQQNLNKLLEMMMAIKYNDDNN